MLSDSITIFYFAKEEQDGRFVPVFPEAHLPVNIPFQKGLGQKFRQPLGTGIDLGFFELDDLSKPSPGEVFPLVIVAETCLAVDLTDEHNDSVSKPPNNMQVTQAVLEKKNGEDFQVRVIRQILWVDGVRYELREIYGIGSSAAEGFDDSDPGKECVICMTEPKDTAVLPCRHMVRLHLYFVYKFKIMPINYQEQPYIVCLRACMPNDETIKSDIWKFESLLLEFLILN